MSGSPTPRLGRAVRAFAPVAVCAVLVLPVISPAASEQPGVGQGKGQGAANGQGQPFPDQPVPETPVPEAPTETPTEAPTEPPAEPPAEPPLAPAPAPAETVPPDSGGGLGTPRDGAPAGDQTGGQPAPSGDGQEVQPAADEDDERESEREDDGDRPARPVTGLAATPPASAKSAAGRQCASRRVVTLRLERDYRVSTASVKLNGKTLAVRRTGRGLVAVVDLRGRGRGTYTVRTTVVTKGGRIRLGTRRFRTCRG